MLTDVTITPVGGPATKTLLYEVAAQAMLVVSSGSCGLIGPRSAAGIEPGHVSGLEARFMGEVAHTAAGMRRSEANRIVNELVPRYQHLIGKRPIGKRFDEVYDLDTLKPTEEWLGMYHEVKDELAELGFKIDTAAVYDKVGRIYSR
jgi:methylamine--corrinoid protein Co-methyltransferase